MTDKELRKLSRLELLELMVSQGKEIEALKAKLDTANEEIEKMSGLISSAGEQLKTANEQIRSLNNERLFVNSDSKDISSLEEVTLKLNDMLKEAYHSSEDFMNKSMELYKCQMQMCAEREENIKRQTEQMILETNLKCEEMVKTTIEECKQKRRATRRKCEAAMKFAQKKIDEYYSSKFPSEILKEELIKEN